MNSNGNVPGSVNETILVGLRVVVSLDALSRINCCSNHSCSNYFIHSANRNTFGLTRFIWGRRCATLDPPLYGVTVSSQTPKNEVAEQVLRSIRQIVRRISAYSKHLSQHVGLTVPQLLCLKSIGQLEEAGDTEITVAKVGTAVSLSPATVSRIIDRLVQDQLVNRDRTAKDRRKVCLSLTTLGLERYSTLPTPLQERFVERFSEVSLDERVKILDSLKRLVELMDAAEIDAAPILHYDDGLKLEEDSVKSRS